MDTRRRPAPDPRLARLLQPPAPASRAGSPNPMLDLTIELARARAAMASMGAALNLIAISDRDAITTGIAQDAIKQALRLMP